jgi:hypothetical protein
MTELNTYLATSTTTEKTKEGYINLYRRLISTEMFDYPINYTSEVNIIKILNTFDKSKMPLLNVCIILKKHFNKSTSKLERYRQQQSIKQLEIKKIENYEMIKDLPTVNTLNNHLNEMFVARNSVGHIINWLLINLNVRNMDLIVTITRDKKPLDNTINYLIIRSKDVLYIRNSYKTFSTYGQKRIVIKDKHFIKSCISLGDVNLINNCDNLTQAVIKYTYNALTESDYFKSILIETPKEKLLEMSNNRGSNVNTILQYYDLLRF